MFHLILLPIRIRKTSWYPYLVPILLPFAQIGLTGSMYFTLALSIERYTTVVHPFFKVTILSILTYHIIVLFQISHAWSSYVYIIPVSVFSFLYNIPKFFELSTELKIIPVDNNSSEATGGEFQEVS